MLWNEIYMFFVKYVFGGVYRTPTNNTYEVYNGLFGNKTDTQNLWTKDVSFEIFGQSISFGNYMSLVCTAISTIFIVILCCLFVYRLVRLVGRLFSGGTL